MTAHPGDGGRVTLRTITPPLDDAEAAAYLRLGRSTLRQLRADGTGPRWARVGIRALYRVEDLDAWLIARATQLPASPADHTNGDRTAP